LTRMAARMKSFLTGSTVPIPSRRFHPDSRVDPVKLSSSLRQ
jgi:hypothetical protein